MKSETAARPPKPVLAAPELLAASRCSTRIPGAPQWVAVTVTLPRHAAPALEVRSGGNAAPGVLLDELRGARLAGRMSGADVRTGLPLAPAAPPRRRGRRSGWGDVGRKR